MNRFRAIFLGLAASCILVPGAIAADLGGAPTRPRQQ